MNKLNRISLFSATFAGSILFIFSNISVNAASLTTTAPKAAVKAVGLSQAQQTDLNNLKSKGNSEISRRLSNLNSALSSINATTKLSSSDKTYLESEINNEISGLTSLQTTLSGETTLAAARTDVQSIFNDYRVYALILPKARLVSSADAELNTDSKLSALAGSIQTQITTDQTAGKNVTTLQSDLTSMQSDISSAQTIANSIESNVLPLQPSDYNSDHTILSGDLSQIKTAHSDNVTAYNEAKTIVSGLKSL